MVLDSPFSDLSALIQEFLNKYKVRAKLCEFLFRMPVQVVAKIAGNYLVRKIKEKIANTAGFKVEDLRPLDHIANVQCPVLFLHGTKDDLIAFRHSKELFEVD